MKKIIISIISAMALLSACEKVSLNDPTTNPISVVSPADTAKVKPPVSTTPPTTPPVTTTPPTTTTPPVTTTPPTTTTPPATTPPVTTPPATAALSFSKDVIPVLNQCENCHSHGWTPSTVATTYYSNLVSKGYVVAANYTSSKIYTKLMSGHPGSGSISTANTNKIIDWMKAGSLNN